MTPAEALLEAWTDWDRAPANRDRVTALQHALNAAAPAGMDGLELRRQLLAERHRGASRVDAANVVLGAVTAEEDA